MISLGCDKNRVDSEYMLAALEGAGHTLVQDENDAEVMIVNTCAFLSSAREESIDVILGAAELKKRGLKLLIVTGCLPQNHVAELKESLPEVDAFLGVREFDRIAEVIRGLSGLDEAGSAEYGGDAHANSTAYQTAQALQEAEAPNAVMKQAKPVTKVPKAPKPVTKEAKAPKPVTKEAKPPNAFAKQSEPQITEALHEAEALNTLTKQAEPVTKVPKAPQRVLTTQPHVAYLRVADGCSNACTYCLIPRIRGRYISRPMEEIVAEAETLVYGGVKELILVAQDVSAYGEDLYGEVRLTELIGRLSKLDVMWIRLLYCYPERVDDALIAEIRDNPKIVKYLDAPFQHASDRILSAMGRRFSRAEMEGLVSRLRGEIPGIVLRSSFIVGFPGESRADFDSLCDFLREFKIEYAGFFAYSREDGTRAARFPGQLNEREKQARLKTARQLQAGILAEANAAYVGKRIPVIADGIDFDLQCFHGRHAGQTPDVDPRVLFTSPEIVESGEVYLVEVESAGIDLYGRVVEKL